MKTAIKILVVDDEEDLCEILQFNLEREGYEVDIAYSAEEALRLKIAQYDLFLLDVMMGEMSGFKLAKHIKEISASKETPIIFLTAKDTENDKLTGFSVGCDDYLPKPYSINELSARVRAILKRTAINKKNRVEPTSQLREISYKSLRLNLEQKLAQIDGKEIVLTKKEFEILFLFLSKPNIVFSREQLLKEVWKDESIVLDRTIDVNITRLRKKISPYDEFLTTRQGYGYSFTTE